MPTLAVRPRTHRLHALSPPSLFLPGSLANKTGTMNPAILAAITGEVIAFIWMALWAMSLARPMVIPVLDCVLAVLFRRTIGQVAQRIISMISVKVADDLPVWQRANKSQHHQCVCAERAPPALFPQIVDWVSATVNSWL